MVSSRTISSIALAFATCLAALPAQAADHAPQRTFSPGDKFSASAGMTPERSTVTADQASAWRPAIVKVDEGVAASVSSAEPGDAAARAKLVAELNGELQRTGCLAPNGTGAIWGDASKRAAQKFLAAVNAALPVDEPDYILLFLLQGQDGRVCDTVAESKPFDTAQRMSVGAVAAEPEVAARPKRTAPRSATRTVEKIFTQPLGAM